MLPLLSFAMAETQQSQLCLCVESTSSQKIATQYCTGAQCVGAGVDAVKRWTMWWWKKVECRRARWLAVVREYSRARSELWVGDSDAAWTDWWRAATECDATKVDFVPTCFCLFYVRYLLVHCMLLLTVMFLMFSFNKIKILCFSSLIRSAVFTYSRITSHHIKSDETKSHEIEWSIHAIRDEPSSKLR